MAAAFISLSSEHVLKLGTCSQSGANTLTEQGGNSDVCAILTEHMHAAMIRDPVAASMCVQHMSIYI